MTTERGNFPIESDSQQIGRLARRALSSCMPKNWIDKELDGDSDFGLDYLIQLKDDESKVLSGFYLQLKGTCSPNFVNDGKEISFQFNCSTLNLYREHEPAVMVAIVDLSADESPKNCPVYYKWLDEDFLDQIKERIGKNEKVSIRISKSNLVTENLDVLPYCVDRVVSRDHLIDLRRAVLNHKPDANAEIQRLTQIIENKPVILELHKDELGAPWIDNPEEHNAGKLKLLSDSILHNNLSRAKKIIEDIELIENLSNHEKAEFLSLQATLDTLKGEVAEAESKYAVAYGICKESRYKVRYVESKLSSSTLPSEEAIEKLISDLDPSVYQEASVLAKLLALLGKESEAISVLDKFASDKCLSAKLVVYTLSGNHEKFDELVTQTNPDELAGIPKLVFHLLAGRRYFYKGIAWEESDQEKEIIPSKGKRTYDFGALKLSFFHISAALELAKENGYPRDTYLILETACPLYSILNNESDLIRILEDLVNTRGVVPELTTHLLPLLFNTHQYERAVDLLERSGDMCSEKISIYIACHYHLEKKKDVVRLLEKHKEVLINERPQNYDSLFCMGAQCAYEILDADKESEFLSICKGFESGDELIAIYHYLKGRKKASSNIKELNFRLYNSYSESKSYRIAEQLFSALDVEDKEESAWVCELGREILVRRELYPGERVTLGYALSINSAWEDLLALCQKVEEYGELDNLWALFKSSALDGLGRSAEALELLDHSLSRDSRSLERAENYVGLCVRLGFFDKAADKLEELLNSSTKNSIAILQSLIFIYSSSPDYADKLIAALTRFGEEVDQNNEEQEGAYLTAFFVLTNRPDVDVSALAPEFRNRLSAFISRFPDSRILRMGRVSDTESPQKLLEEIRNLAGINDERLIQWRRNRNLIRARRLPVPFSMLEFFLDDVGDIFTAWVLAKYLGRERKEYQLLHSSPSKRAVEKLIEGGLEKIIIEETSLLCLSELGILDVVLELFPKIVVRRTTYNSFSKASHFAMGSIYSNISRKIVDSLGSHLDRISVEGGDENGDFPINGYRDLSTPESSSVVVSDDAYVVEYLKGVGVDSINTISLLDYLLKIGKLRHEEWVFLTEQFCGFGISGPTISYDHVFQIVESYLEKNSDAELLSTGFRNIFDAMFPPDTGFQSALERISKMFSGLLNRNHADIDISVLKELLSVWMVRFPEMNRIELIANWFVMTAANAKVIVESSLVKVSRGQSTLWDIVKALSLQERASHTLKDIFTSIANVILVHDPAQASDIFDIVKKAFIEGSAEYDDFVRVYNERAIEVRLAVK